MNRSATVSICIPVYNRARQLNRAIESARNQSFADIEIVVVDNASTDSTFAVAAQHAEQDSRVRLSQNAITMSKADNWHRALELAEGEYVILLFSDDWLAPEAVERLVTGLRDREDIAFAFGPMTWEPENGSKACYETARPRDMPSWKFLEKSATLADLVPVTSSSVLIRRSDALELLPRSIATKTGLDTNRLAIGYSGTMLWRTALNYDRVHHVGGSSVAFSADDLSGDKNARTRMAHQYESLWWAHRNALSCFIELDIGTDSALAGRLTGALFFNTVAFRAHVFRSRLATFRQLFPEFSLRRLRLPRLHLFAWVVFRIAVPPHPIEILGPQKNSENTTTLEALNEHSDSQ